eukprot:GHUV01039902.1.p1 GENE.GHUV01039902.1~~GHUV01039902.1.p1  ORF type:complete len:110 (+),score=30.86 GHUV01039902.1:3-332(+)
MNDLSMALVVECSYISREGCVCVEVFQPISQPVLLSHAGGAAASRGQDKRRKEAASAAAALPPAAPRWYVTAGELASVPSYMKGRLTLEKVCCWVLYEDGLLIGCGSSG